MRTGVRKYRQKLGAAVDEVRVMLQDKNITYAQIQTAYDLTPADIQQLAKDEGIRRHKPRTEKSEPESKPVALPVSELQRVNAQIEDAQRILRETAAQLEHLRDLKERLALSFAWEGKSVIVYGVGEEPFKATAEEWMRFLNNEGARKLRDFIGKRVQQ